MRAQRKTAGTTRAVVSESRISDLRNAGLSWRAITKELKANTDARVQAVTTRTNRAPTIEEIFEMQFQLLGARQASGVDGHRSSTVRSGECRWGLCIRESAGHVDSFEPTTNLGVLGGLSHQ
jgi:hypothetical protein